MNIGPLPDEFYTLLQLVQQIEQDGVDVIDANISLEVAAQVPRAIQLGVAEEVRTNGNLQLTAIGHVLLAERRRWRREQVELAESRETLWCAAGGGAARAPVAEPAVSRHRRRRGAAGPVTLSPNFDAPLPGLDETAGVDAFLEVLHRAAEMPPPVAAEGFTLLDVVYERASSVCHQLVREHGYGPQAQQALQRWCSAWLAWRDADDAAQRCRVCGCTDDDCRQCIAKTGHACSWVEDDLCSACAEPPIDAEFESDDWDEVAKLEAYSQIVGDFGFRVRDGNVQITNLQMVRDGADGVLGWVGLDTLRAMLAWEALGKEAGASAEPRPPSSDAALGRREVWSCNIRVSFEVPSDQDSPWQLPCVDLLINEGKLNERWPERNSTKVSAWDEAVASIVSDVLVFLQRQSEPQAELDKSAAARAGATAT